MTLGAAIGLPFRAPSRVLYLPTALVAAATGVLVWLATSTLKANGNLGRVLGSRRAELVAPTALALVTVTLAAEGTGKL